MATSSSEINDKRRQSAVWGTEQGATGVSPPRTLLICQERLDGETLSGEGVLEHTPTTTERHGNHTSKYIDTRRKIKGEG